MNTVDQLNGVGPVIDGVGPRVVDPEVFDTSSVVQDLAARRINDGKNRLMPTHRNARPERAAVGLVQCHLGSGRDSRNPIEFLLSSKADSGTDMIVGKRGSGTSDRCAAIAAAQNALQPKKV